MPTATSKDWICAPATAVGASERAVIRLSGFSLIENSAKILPLGIGPIQARRQAISTEMEWCEGAFVSTHVLVFPAPASATGEDVIELHLQGSPPIVEHLVQRLAKAGVRLAEAGEFTRRAFVNGKLDLSQAAAVLDLVESNNQQQASAAAQMLSGTFGSCLAQVRGAVFNALSELEASLDFEEGDSQDVQVAEVEDLLMKAQQELELARSSSQVQHSSAASFRVKLWGQPNVGKTTIFNRLVATDALVSSTAGTTRDRLEAVWQHSSFSTPVLLADLPGAGQSCDQRDQAAQVRAAQENADLWLLVSDASQADPEIPELPNAGPSILIWNKLDCGRQISAATVAKYAHIPQLWASNNDSDWISELAGLCAQQQRAWSGVGAARQHRSTLQANALNQAAEALTRAVEMYQQQCPTDILAEELREVLRPLGELLGELTPDDLLDRIFARFCIGK